MHITKIIPASAGALLLVALAACSSSSSSGGSVTAATGGSAAAGASASSGKSLTVDYAAPVMAEPGQQQMVSGMKQAAALSGSTVTAYDSNVQSSTQISNMQTMLQQKPGVIGTWTLDPGATAGIYGQIVSAGIPLIGVNSDDNGIKHSIWYQLETCTAGSPEDQTAQLMAKKYPGGTVITIGLQGVPSIDSQVSCFTQFAKKAGLKVIANVSNTSDDSAGAQQLTADLLTKYPGVDAVWAYNDNSALGASAAVIASGKKVSDGTSPGVIITGANGDADAIQAVAQGRLTATWDDNNVEFGWLFMKMAEEVAAGGAPAEMVLKTTLIDKATAGSWVAPAQRKLSFAALQYTVVK
jgi:ribose transport system substrate-binding protein